MECKYFGKCGSCTLHELNYEEQLKYKVDMAKKTLQTSIIPTIITSSKAHYRDRAEFKLWHEGDELHLAMHKPNKNEKLIIDACPKANQKINALFTPLLSAIKQESILKERLFGIEFLSSKDDMLITLLYHKKIDEEWEKRAKVLSDLLHVKIVGRSRKVKKVIGDDFITQALQVDKKTYNYHIQEGSFSQPNSSVNEGMIGWVKESLEVFTCKDLLELYCGHGNFTIALSKHFNKVLATEISKSSIKSARQNCLLNDVKNITFLRMSSEELVSALNKEREFFRLRELNLDNFSFSHIFVDPPRAGLDIKSIEFISRFKNIIYISCSVDSLARDLKLLQNTHKIKKVAFFDQFPYTKHLESGVILEKLD